MIDEIPNIYKFNDIVSFFEAYILKKRENSSYWSLGSWANYLGLSTTSSITNIVKGRRIPNDKFIIKMANSIKLDKYQRDYFYKLFQKHKAKDQIKLKVLIERELSNCNKAGRVKDISEEITAKILKNEYYTIREMVKLESFTEDPEWINSRLVTKLSHEEINNIISFLLKNGLLKRDKITKQLQLSEDYYATTHDISSSSIKEYHKEICHKAISAIDNFTVEKRNFTGNTFTVDSSDLPAIKQHVEEFRKNLMFLYERNEGNQVFQFETLLFPLTIEVHVEN